MGDKLRVQELDLPNQERLKSLFKGMSKFARFGDTGYTMYYYYKDDADYIRNMTVRPDDVWVITFPRSGTTRTQELVWLLKNDFDYDRASKIDLLDRYLLISPTQSGGKEVKLKVTAIEDLASAPSPRFIKTHIPFSLLPERLLDTCKVLYVARDPRDVAVSRYHHNKLHFHHGYVGDFKTYWDLFLSNLLHYTPYFPHVKEAWARRHHPNMLFLFYEDMSKDLPASIKRIASFLGKDLTEEQMARLCQHLDIKNFRNNKSVNRSSRADAMHPSAEGFIRKGVVGDWRTQFDDEMTTQAQAWMDDHLADTDLRFPDA